MTAVSCLTNNAAERALRGIALGRKSWLFAGSDRGGERAAAMYSLIVTAKLNDIDPQAWLADVLTRIGRTPGRAARRSCCPGNWPVQASRHQPRCLKNPRSCGAHRMLLPLIVAGPIRREFVRDAVLCCGLLRGAD